MPFNKRLGFWVFIVIGLCAIVALTSSAVHSSGAYWASFRDAGGDWVTNGSSGFIVVGMSGDGEETADDGKEERSGVGPLPWAPSMEEEELVIQDTEEESADTAPYMPQVVWREVQVRGGDSLSTISEREKVGAKDIARANCLKNMDVLKEGQILLVPNTDEDVEDTRNHILTLRKLEEEASKKVEKLDITYYVIKEGDSLWSIANVFDLDVNTMFGSNKLSDVNMLKPGNTIRVPNQDGVFIKVKKGDTMDKLAKEYGIFTEAIMDANGFLAGSTLMGGAEVFLPGAKPQIASEGSSKNSGSTPHVRGYIWPLRGKINSAFGWRGDPFSGRRDLHTGIDIKGPSGRNVVAAAGGTVVHSGWMGGYGKTIVIAHRDGSTTFYAHCSKLTKSAGATVKQGEVVAKVGNTGRSTGPHLHFEIRIGGSPVNPLRRLR